jgi:hypothetical protein
MTISIRKCKNMSSLANFYILKHIYLILNIKTKLYNPPECC